MNVALNVLFFKINGQNSYLTYHYLSPSAPFITKLRESFKFVFSNFSTCLSSQTTPSRFCNQHSQWTRPYITKFKTLIWVFYWTSQQHLTGWSHTPPWNIFAWTSGLHLTLLSPPQLQLPWLFLISIITLASLHWSSQRSALEPLLICLTLSHCIQCLRMYMGLSFDGSYVFDL